MRHYCTLFDSKYLPQGLVLYESLKKHSSEPFTLYVLPLDDGCDRTLESLQLSNLIVLGTRAFEHDMRLQGIKEKRTHQEYAWTCASNLCEWLISCEDCEFQEITYLDADMMFFSDPKVIHDEIGDRSIAVIPHRFKPGDWREVNGQFNVSWVTFKNNPVGRECASTWAAQCREKCSATDGCGDQLYLDAWPAKYGPDLCIIQNIGAGLAPWNLANYKFYYDTTDLDGVPLCVGTKASDSVPVVFYHYHEFAKLDATDIDGPRTIYRYTNYELRPEDIELIYKPYIAAIESLKLQTV